MSNTVFFDQAKNKHKGHCVHRATETQSCHALSSRSASMMVSSLNSVPSSRPKRAVGEPSLWLPQAGKRQDKDKDKATGAGVHVRPGHTAKTAGSIRVLIEPAYKACL